MPNTKNRGNTDFSRFDTMTNEELEEILRLDAENTEGGESDTDMLLYVMEVLTDRKRNQFQPARSAEDAFQSFRENYSPIEFPINDQEEDPVKCISGEPIRRKARWLHRAVVAAAMIAVVFFTSISAQAFGFDLWGTIAKWTQEVFHFRPESREEIKGPIDDYDESLSTLQEALGKKEIPINIIPRWIPDGYECYDLNILDTPKSTTIVASYQNNQGQKIKIQVKQHSDNYVQQVEKGNEYFEIYNVNGDQYYIFNNSEMYYACWTSSNSECCILGSITLDQLYKMLDSIKGGI